MRSIKFAKHKILLIPLSMLAVTLIAGYFLSHIPLGANATTSDVSLHVADTCTMNGVINEGDEHTVSLINGQERTGIGITRLTTLCNDNNGYAIYAIGYSGTTSDPHNTAGELGRTDLIGLTTSLTISTANWADRNTGDNATKSIWSMSLQDNSEVISTMKPTIENGFSNYLAVPTAYTKVASFPAATGATLATASIVNTTYAAKVAAVQSSDTYVGQVKYTMVHPSSNTATGFTFDDAFQLAGKTRVSGTSYFAMQDMNAAICNKVTELNNNFPETQLIDTRDNNIYTIKKINGDCWMTQNLRFTGTTLTPADSNVSANTTMAYYSLDANDASYTDHCDSTNGYNYACIKDSGNDTTGVWYNYAAASAGTITTDDNTMVSNYDVCPAGWHIPTGAAADTSSEFYKLFQSTTAGSWIATNSYLTAFNAVPGGDYHDGSLYYPVYGYWWSATAGNAAGRYGLYYNSSNTQFYSEYGVRYGGLFVRCIADNSMQSFDSTAAASLAINESLQLRDVRDGNIYTVGKLRDGNVWLLDNLRLGGDSPITLTSDDTNIASGTTFTLPASGTANFDSTNGYTNAAINTSLANTDATYRTDYTGEIGKVGVFYNYCAASAGTICAAPGENTSDATYDICPAGWKLPKGDTNNGSYYYLYNTSYGADQESFINALRTPLSGRFQNGSIAEPNSVAYVWSSKRHNLSNMVVLYVSASSVAGLRYNGLLYYGASVRCIAD